MKRTLLTALCILCLLPINLKAQRIVKPLDLQWKFSLGNASDMAKDFGHGTEYFTYYTKVRSNNDTTSPILMKFDDSNWQDVTLPHDWVVDLPYSADASHSHGYKMVGWKYPENSVGWYRRHFKLGEEARGKRVYVQFDAIFRNAQVFCNGFLVGEEPSGYATQIYDITEMLDFENDNLLTVRADASTEMGWYYEGAGIYGHVKLIIVPETHVANNGVYVTSKFKNGYKEAEVSVGTMLRNGDVNKGSFNVVQRLCDAVGKVVATGESLKGKIAGKDFAEVKHRFRVGNPHLWSVEDPYLYTLHTILLDNGEEVDDYTTNVGLRDVRFDVNEGLLINGKFVKIKGTNMHLDHAGVGVAVPDELWRYRIHKLKDMGSNAIRTSHNPGMPAMLDICDKMGMLVLDENRMLGTNDYQISRMKNMIERDRNHPSVIIWSVGNEEWPVEWNNTGTQIARSMCEFVHRMDSTRLATYGNAGGAELIKGLDVQGYNYLIQNDIDGLHKQHPSWIALGTEETSGCGTRGIYVTDKNKGWMNSHNRQPQREGDPNNVIERGWQFYDARPWLSGLFYWTGFDYRGEPNPLVYPATGSLFGIFDYCGFPKDEAYYLKAAWTNEPVLHIFPHWNLQGQEGQQVSLWTYSNCDEVSMKVNGKNLVKRKMPRNGHLEWDAIYKPGKVEATGYKNGKKIITAVLATTGYAKQIAVQSNKEALKANGEDVIIMDISLLDSKGREVPTAMNSMKVKVEGVAEILGYGNGDSAFKEVERPLAGTDKKSLDIKAFNGKIQILLRSINEQKGQIKVYITGENLMPYGKEYKAE